MLFLHMTTKIQCMKFYHTHNIAVCCHILLVCFVARSADKIQVIMIKLVSIFENNKNV
jgi:hypothetical protein